MKTIDADILTAALVGLESQRAGIDEKIRDLKAMLGGKPATSISGNGKARKKRKMSAAGREAISRAATARWATLRKGKKVA